MEEIVRQFFLRKSLLIVADKLKAAILANEQRLKGLYMNLVFASVWKKRMKKWCGEFLDRDFYRKNINRRMFTFNSNAMYDA